MIYTIGTSNRNKSEFKRSLEEHTIETIYDVRSKPYGRFNHFNRGTLEIWAGVEYKWVGSKLGGFQEKIDENYLLEVALVGKDKNIVLVCSEGDPHKCHRAYTLAKALRIKGITATHIKRDGSLAEHDLSFEQPEQAAML